MLPFDCEYNGTPKPSYFAAQYPSLAFQEADYDSFVTDIVNQNVKDDVARIKNFCSIVGSINSESFKMQLASSVTPGMDVFRELETCVFDAVEVEP